MVSAAQSHEVLRENHPKLLSLLYESFVRDVVTPDSDRSLERLARNRFPVFSYDGPLCMRYMRYWIDKGHARIGGALAPEYLVASTHWTLLLGTRSTCLHFERRQVIFSSSTTPLPRMMGTRSKMIWHRRGSCFDSGSIAGQPSKPLREIFYAPRIPRSP